MYAQNLNRNQLLEFVLFDSVYINHCSCGNYIFVFCKIAYNCAIKFPIEYFRNSVALFFWQSEAVVLIYSKMKIPAPRSNFCQLLLPSGPSAVLRVRRSWVQIPRVTFLCKKLVAKLRLLIYDFSLLSCCHSQYTFKTDFVKESSPYIICVEIDNTQSN